MWFDLLVYRDDIPTDGNLCYCWFSMYEWPQKAFILTRGFKFVVLEMWKWKHKTLALRIGLKTKNVRGMGLCLMSKFICFLIILISLKFVSNFVRDDIDLMLRLELMTFIKVIHHSVLPHTSVINSQGFKCMLPKYTSWIGCKLYPVENQFNFQGEVILGKH